MTGKKKAHPSLDILWSKQAKDDLAAIGDYIAVDTPHAAIQWVDKLISDIERAATMPLAGRIVPEYSDHHDIREVFRRVYRIVYCIRNETIEVLTIFEGHRIFPKEAIPNSDNE